MHVIRTFLNLVRSMGRRPAVGNSAHGRRNHQRANVKLEQLDHRRLLSVNFTGNAINDIPVTGVPGSAIVNLDLTNPNTRTPTPIPFPLNSVISVSGFYITAIRMQYTPADDVLSIGLQQAENQIDGNQVIAGDADNNLDGGTVNPAVLALEPQFKDFPSLAGSERMGIFLNFNNPNVPDIVAGISNNPNGTKLYQVADAIVNPSPTDPPDFGAIKINSTGLAFSKNADPAHPNFEFQITNFSKLYKEKTGRDYTATTTFSIGAFGGSRDDFIPEMFLPGQAVTLGLNPITPVCPVSPPVVINPHSDHVVDTAHPTDVRVTLFGTGDFDVRKIVPNSIRLGGAKPIFSFQKKVNGDTWLDATFVFRGSDIDLPPGRQSVVVTGRLKDGTPISSTTRIRVHTAPGSAENVKVKAQRRRLSAAGLTPDSARPTPAEISLLPHIDAALADRIKLTFMDGGLNKAKAEARVHQQSSMTGPAVAIRSRNGGAVKNTVSIALRDQAAHAHQHAAAGPKVAIAQRKFGMGAVTSW